MGVTVNDYRVYFGGEENVLELDDRQLCEYTKNPKTIELYALNG